MTATTIKVDSALRDRLKRQASSEGLTLGDHLAHLAEREDRRLRMNALRDAIAQTPAGARRAYEDDVARLDASLADSGLTTP